MVVASTFAMADVDGTNFYMKLGDSASQKLFRRQQQPGIDFSHDCDPESTPQTVPVAPHRNQICGAPSRFR